MRPTTQGSPLKPDEKDGPESPEALFISALLGSGEFQPTKFGITDSDLSCYKALFRFCSDHHDRVGRGPAIELVNTSFPDFTYTPKIDEYWAAGQLRRSAWNRNARQVMGEATAYLNDEDVENTYSALASLPPPMGVRRPAVEGFDASYLEEDISATRLPVPWDSLGRVTGGIGWNELWYLGARTGHGKTNVACSYVARMVKDGFVIAYWSLEMPAKLINEKIRRCLANSDVPLLKKLDSDSKEDKKRALDELAERTPGAFRTFDPSHGSCTIEAIRDAQAESDLVVIDHVGLMTTSDGRRAVDDWRVEALISNRLKEETLRNGPPIFGLLQANRTAETSSPLRCPKLSEMSGSDHYGRDCDVGITMTRYSDSVMTHETQKVRNDRGVRWFTQYDPKNAQFGEVTRRVAEVIASRDEDRRSGY